MAVNLQCVVTTKLTAPRSFSYRLFLRGGSSRWLPLQCLRSSANLGVQAPGPHEPAHWRTPILLCRMWEALLPDKQLPGSLAHTCWEKGGSPDMPGLLGGLCVAGRAQRTLGDVPPRGQVLRVWPVQARLHNPVGLRDARGGAQTGGASLGRHCCSPGAVWISV